MKMQPIGRTGLEVTPLCFGASVLGSMPDTYGYAIDEEQAFATVNAILDGPVNFLDTSRNYGFGRSEERVGKVIAQRGGLPENFVVSTKLDRDTETGRFDADRARQSFEESLEALSLDKVQILHLHDPEHARDLDEITRKGGALDELYRIRDEGLAVAVGLAMGPVDMMMQLLREYPFDVLISHNRYTLLNRNADELFDYAHNAGISILNAAPYASGVLAKGADVMPIIAYSKVGDAELKPVRKIEKLCASRGIAPGAAALQFSMRDPRIASTIVGVSKPQRISQTLEWASADISDEIWRELGDLPFDTSDPEANRDYKLG